MNQYRAPIAVIGACATAVVIAASAAAAPPATTLSHTGATLSFRVQFRPPDQNYVDLGSPGPGIGDTLVFQDALTDTRARRVGVEGGVCTITAVLSGGLQTHCAGTVSVTGGQIAFQGLVSNAPVKPLAVVGGTGKYVGARGEAVLVELGHDHAGTLTIRLLPRED